MIEAQWYELNSRPRSLRSSAPTGSQTHDLSIWLLPFRRHGTNADCSHLYCTISQTKGLRNNNSIIVTFMRASEAAKQSIVFIGVRPCVCLCVYLSAQKVKNC